VRELLCSSPAGLPAAILLTTGSFARLITGHPRSHRYALERCCLRHCTAIATRISPLPFLSPHNPARPPFTLTFYLSNALPRALRLVSWPPPVTLCFLLADSLPPCQARRSPSRYWRHPEHPIRPLGAANLALSPAAPTPGTAAAAFRFQALVPHYKRRRLPQPRPRPFETTLSCCLLTAAYPSPLWRTYPLSPLTVASLLVASRAYGFHTISGTTGVRERRRPPVVPIRSTL